MNVIPNDGHMVVPVRPRVLVPEADHVTQLVDDDAELVTVLPDRDRLRPVAPPPHVRAAPVTGRGREREGGEREREREREGASVFSYPQQKTKNASNFLASLQTR